MKIGFIIKFTKIILLVSVVFLFPFQALADAKIQTPQKNTQEITDKIKIFDLQAHRGGSGYVPPGNTLAAFEYAMDLQVTTIELDVHASKDGYIVVIHDNIVPKEWKLSPEAKNTDVPDPQTAAKKDLEISKLKLKELKNYRCKLPVDLLNIPGRDPDNKNLIINSDYDTIPTLNEVFIFTKVYANNKSKTKSQRENASKLRFNIDLKRLGIEKQLINTIKSHHFENRVHVGCTNHTTVAKIIKMAPDIRTIAIGGEPSKIKNGIKADTWEHYHKNLNAENINLAHSLGFRVLAWTVDDPKEMIRLMDLGIDGILTNYPNVLKDILEKRNIPYNEIKQ
jgi:glycerophosphoryl diester phosphodiesterase